LSRIGWKFRSPTSLVALGLFCVSLPLTNASSQQLNSNDPCSKYVNEDWQPPFSNPRPSEDQLSRADRLYSRSIVMTAHDHCYAGHDFADMKAGGITVRTIKLTTDNTSWAGGVERDLPRGKELDFSSVAKEAVKIVKDNPDVWIIHGPGDAAKAKRAGKLGVIVSFEGGAVAPRPQDGCLHPPCEDCDCMRSIRALHDLGLREFQPYWAADNWLKSQTTSDDPDWEHVPLNPYGVSVVTELDNSGVVIDLSHMGLKTFKQALKLTEEDKKPFILSHAAVAWVSLCGPKATICQEYEDWTKTQKQTAFRSEFGPPGGSMMLDEAAICDVVRRHGVIALHFMDRFVSWRHWSAQPRVDATVADLVDEIDYIKQKFGIDYVALGPDYIPWEDNDHKWVRGLRDMTELKNVAREMVIRGGFSDQDIQKVLGLNLLQLYESVWKTSRP
jgi:microsomal dipeptidase-like Zn-dependent dipeptidase